MVKILRVDFYKISMPSGAEVSFEELLKQKAESPDDESRNINVSGSPIRLKDAGILDAELFNGFWQGDMMRIRMEGIPIKASLSGEVEEIDLEDDEGIGEETAFLYHPATGILMLQRNRFGVSDSAFASYFESRVSSVIELLPIPRLGALEKFERLNGTRKFTFTLAGVDRLPQVTDEERAVFTGLGMAEQLEAPNIQITASMGNRNGTLEQGMVKKWVSFLFALNATGSNPVKKIEVTGESSDAKKEILDLLDLKMTDAFEITPDANRRYSFDKRLACLKAAWTKNKAEVESHFNGVPQTHDASK